MRASQLLDEIRHRLGGPVSTQIGGGIEIINQAGRHLFNMHRWRCAERVRGTASYVADQDWVALPAGFIELLDIERTDVAGRRVEPIGPGEMVALRQSWTAQVTDWGLIRVSVENLSGTSWRLGVFPTPTAAAADALSFAYRVGWTDIDSDSATVPVMPYQETLLRTIVREMAYGYEVGALDERLAGIQAGLVFATAARVDGGVQSTLGRMRGPLSFGTNLNPFAYVRPDAPS